MEQNAPLWERDDGDNKTQTVEVIYFPPLSSENLNTFCILGNCVVTKHNVLHYKTMWENICPFNSRHASEFLFGLVNCFQMTTPM